MNSFVFHPRVGFDLHAITPRVLTTICAKRRRCDDAAPDISARGDLPSPRPFFRRTRGDSCIKAFFWLAMATETTIFVQPLDRHQITGDTRTTPFQHALHCKYRKCLKKFTTLIFIHTDHLYIFVCILCILCKFIIFIQSV